MTNVEGNGRFAGVSPDRFTIRVGCELTYDVPLQTPALMILRPHRSPTQRITQELLSFEPNLSSTEEIDTHGNIVDRLILKPGLNVIRHDALVTVNSSLEQALWAEMAVPVEKVPLSLLRYTQPSRYCDSDQLMDFSQQQFGHNLPGAATVRAIADWVHNNIEYRFGSGTPDTTASQVIDRRYGVCRDFAHATAALCRTFNIPARYVTGHLADIGFLDSGSPMDFHAYTEVYVGNQWYVVDARFNLPRIGRIRIASGLDAVDGAFATIYGEGRLISFYVWTYQVDPAHSGIGGPVDLSHRLDGTLAVRCV